MTQTQRIGKMSRYYFDLHNGEGPVRDDQGIDLPSRERVSLEVAKILLDIARDEMPAGNRSIISITVRDFESRAIAVATLTFNHEWLD